MNDRTMVKVVVSKDVIFLKTLSHRKKSPHRFAITRAELKNLEAQVGAKKCIIKDITSYAVLRLYKMEKGIELLEITFTWLSDNGNNKLCGWSEVIRIPYEQFHEFAKDDGSMEGQKWNILSILQQTQPKIEFVSNRNLHAVVKMPILRHKLGKLLDNELNWANYDRIVLTDDFTPYSFCFAGYGYFGLGLCGGIILHGQEDMRKAYYSIHT